MNRTVAEIRLKNRRALAQARASALAATQKAAALRSERRARALGGAPLEVAAKLAVAGSTIKILQELNVLPRSRRVNRLAADFYAGSIRQVADAAVEAVEDALK